MGSHSAGVHWSRGEAVFTDQRYSRAHEWRFDGGLRVPAAASPHVVPPECTDAAAVDPEEALVAAAASCHMLWFLSLAARRGFVVDDYADDAAGTLARDERGRQAITRIVLRPRVRFAPDRAPDATALARLHHDAHEACYIANSLRSEIAVEPA
jgi:organic hydroperoxide reductase OsmC/OhrA